MSGDLLSDKSATLCGIGAVSIGAVFLDRDNTLIVDRLYMYKIEDFCWWNGAVAALRRFQAAGIRVFVVTNQGGVALGRFTVEDMNCFHRHLQFEASKAGGNIIDVAACIHHPDAPGAQANVPCSCRKPQPGLILQLAAKWGVDLRASVMIGDRASDVEAGLRAGCHSYLFDGGDLSLLAEKVERLHFGKIS